MNIRRRGQLLVNRALRLRDLYGLRGFYQPTCFDLNDLIELNRCFTPPLHSEYDLASRRQRALARMAKLRRFGDLENARVVDVGTGRGELVWAAAHDVRQSIGVDIDAAGLRNAAREGGEWPPARNDPVFVQADAARLPMKDASLDIVASYWAFEHFPDYRGVFSEFDRVLRRGGIAYLEFGPLFYSPWGSHLYRFLYIPWVHLLFNEEVIRAYLRQINQQTWIEAFEGLNRLTIGKFRQLVNDSRMTVRHWSCQMAPLGRLPQVLRSRLASYPVEDRRCSNVTCILQKQ
jgi:ubiquinone/menaquinone biosynthesis C-methylase UbiE